MSITKHSGSTITGKVVLWCCPRTMSTVMTKCLSGIDGISVYNELYSYVQFFRGIYGRSTGRELPMTQEGNEAVFEEANEMWEKTVGERLDPNKLTFLEIKGILEDASKKKYVFVKEMAFLMDQYREYLPNGFVHTFLIREPSRVYVSYKKTTFARFPDLLPKFNEYDIIRDDISVVPPLSWFEGQRNLWRYCKETLKQSSVIIEASDLAAHPKETLQAYSKATGLPYSDSLLQWEPSTKVPDNFTMAGPNVFDDMSKFYDRAFSSTHFMAPGKEASGPIPRDQLSADVIRCVDHSMPFYEEMYNERLRVL